MVDRIHAVGESLTTWTGGIDALDRALDELKAARKQLQSARGRPQDDTPTIIAKRERLLELVLPVAEKLWGEIQDGPTLERVAARTHYSAPGLRNALARAGLSWSEVKALSRRRNFRVILGMEPARKIA